MMNRRESRVDMDGRCNVIEAHNGDIFRHAHFVFDGRIQHAVGSEVIAGKDRRWRLGHAEELLRTLITTLAAIIPLQDERRIKAQVGGLQRFTIALVAIVGTLNFGQAANKADTAMSQFQQVTNSLLCGRDIIDAYLWQVYPGSD